VVQPDRDLFFTALFNRAFEDDLVAVDCDAVLREKLFLNIF
jgi:hypothetical protein